ncbi:MAG: elongation factor Ts [Candidatus Magasanikbacteria bacterium CG10_big_fil_rev_8_21_14_0_10_40_10]|uniref:Elongation factor Ts n=1 Tax=Candidatus Magasanikbacteria bacterium CG10_big_fil_rev_8_21_14_0_10_40_10 TaxID=1974648 RepID=A0A2M6W3J3_9BACT|nr:MAG: elongation factor Ts [Candidatus Magasanikbacteria bacterium CG10_big_fil_rev_8_21_14_0_10_40_10]
MAINTSDVAKLRVQTGAGMMDCKNALEEANGDMEKANEILRKKGIVKAAKRAGKIAAEGIVNVKSQGNRAVILEVNSETDFVAKNEDFQKVMVELTECALVNSGASLEEILKSQIAGQSVEDYLVSATAKAGEKIDLRRLSVLEKTDSDCFGAYIHMGGKIGVLVLLAGSTDENLARDIAMHAAAANPRYLDSASVPAEVVEKEKEIYTEQLKTEGKPANIMENILKGKLNKFYEEVCLVDQPYIKDDKKKIRELLPAGSQLKAYVRFELGEGLEKQSKDFATEVAEQMGK